jgi:hypothetical protein
MRYMGDVEIDLDGGYDPNSVILVFVACLRSMKIAACA